MNPRLIRTRHESLFTILPLLFLTLFLTKKKSNPRKRNEGAFHAWYGMVWYVWVREHVCMYGLASECEIVVRFAGWWLKHVAELETVTACREASHWSVSYANMGLCAGRKAKLSPPFSLSTSKKTKNEIEKKGHARYTSINHWPH